MVKMKKIIALSCVATMLFSSTALAAGVDDTVEGGGNSVVENDNSTAPHIDRLVLPTAGANTYDFTIDPDELLANFDPITYATGQSVYFNATKTAATLDFENATAATGYGLYVQKKVEDTGLAKLTAELTAATATITGITDGTHDSVLAKFFVWVPDTDNEGEGKFIPLSGDNVEKVLKFTDDGGGNFASAALNIEAGSQSNLAGDFIWDGTVYTIGYESISKEKAAVEYYQPAVDATPASVKAGLFVADTSDIDGTAAPAALGTGGQNLAYTAAVMQQTGTTDAATIVNKSTFDIGVIAEVTVTNGTGLTFLNSSTIAGDDVTASIYMALTDGTNEAAVDNTTGKATAYYVVKGTGDEAHTYQIEATTGTETGTGSHVYKQYLTSTQTYSDVNFQITAKANTNAGAADAWEDYVETLTATEDAQTKPSIGVVFKFVEIDDAEKTSVTEDATTTYYATFTGKDDSVFSIEAASDSDADDAVAAGGWATYTAGERAPSIADTEVTYSRAGSTVIQMSYGAGSVKATAVSKVLFGATADSQTTDATSSFTIDNTAQTLTIPVGSFGAGAVGTAKYIKVQFDDESTSTDVVIKINITQ